jgi:hypothetical protein
MNNASRTVFSEGCAGDAMRVALATLCIGAVAFLLRVLAAFVQEGMRSRGAVRAHFMKFNPSRQRGQLIEMSTQAERPSTPSRVNERIAL